MVIFKKKIQARGEKIQANDGHMLIIRELGGSLYLFGWLLYKLIFRKRYKLEVDSVGKYKRVKI